jgi:quercetin dioxygenase-like cupin family protein
MCKVIAGGGHEIVASNNAADDDRCVTGSRADECATVPRWFCPRHVPEISGPEVGGEKLIPELGAASAEIAILNVDPKSGATQLMIRSPKNYHAPKHWHTANETHTVISGTFIMQHDGGAREELGPGSYNRMPSKMIHEAWSKPDEGNLVFITVDGPWDLNLVDGPTGKMPPAK